MKTIVFLCILGYAAASANINYSGAQVLRVLPETEAQVSILGSLERGGEYDFWTEIKSAGHNVDIMAKRWMVPILKANLQRAGIDYTVMMSDVQTAVHEFMASNEKSREINGKAMDWLSYHTYDEFNEWIDTLPGLYPSLVTVTDVGQSYEGRTMKLIRVSQNSGSAAKSMFIDGGIHAREWIAPATVSFMLNELLMNNGDYASTLAVVDFYFMVPINPDGYEYTFTDDRLWRKTRSPNVDAGCFGTDANRNWDYMWGGEGASPLPCTDTYMGTEAFSEVETQNVRDQMLAVASTTNIYLTYHSYGQYFLYPWGYTVDFADDCQEMHDLGQAAADAVEAVHGTVYEVGDGGELLYPASGASDDYAKGVAGIKYSYTVELRDTGTFGFLLPENQIIPTGEESFAGFQVMFEFARDN